MHCGSAQCRVRGDIGIISKGGGGGDVISAAVIRNGGVLFSFAPFLFRRGFFIQWECKIIFDDPGGVPPERLVDVVDRLRCGSAFRIRMDDEMGIIQFRTFFLSSGLSGRIPGPAFLGTEERISAVFAPISSGLTASDEA